MQLRKYYPFAATLAAGMFLGYLFFGGESAPPPDNFLSAVNCAPHEVKYSCAMHPQVQSADNGTCPLCNMPLTGARAGGNPALLTMSPQAVKLANIQTAVVEKAGMQEKKLLLSGKILPDESRIYRQVAHLPGRIEKLYINKTGQEIRKGQPVASIFSKELIASLEVLETNGTSAGMIRSAENNLAGWNISKDQLKKFSVKSGDYRKPIDILAEVSGTVIKKLAVEGDETMSTYMGPPSVLYEVADLSRVWVVFDAYERDLNWIKKGDVIDFFVPAYPDRSFSGTVSYIDKMIDPQTRTAGVRLEVKNPGELLKPEMLASGHLRARRNFRNDGLLIPKSAVLWTGKRSVVYVKNTEFRQTPVFEYREVRLGNELEEFYTVLQGLHAGEEIVVNGVFQVDAAAQLGNKRSMMNEIPMAKEVPVSPKRQFVEGKAF